MVKVSIIVPCYNVEKYIRKCIESLMAQTLKDIEIILVDDGSPDKSGQICDEYAKIDTRIKVIHKANGGASAARNDGFRLATGEFVIFVDSDDYVPSDAYEAMYEKAVATDSDIVIGDVCKDIDGAEEYCTFYKDAFVSDDKSYIEKLICADFYKNYCPDPPASGAAFGYGGPWNKLVRRSLIVDNGVCFDVRVKGLFDDIIYSAYILANCTRVSYIQKNVYYYRILGNSITQTYKKNMPEIASAIINSFNEFMDRYNTNNAFDKAYYAFVVRLLAYSLPRYYCNKKNELSRGQRVKQLKAIMNSEPYKTASREVERDILTKGQNRLSLLIKYKAALLAVVYFETR